VALLRSRVERWGRPAVPTVGLGGVSGAAGASGAPGASGASGGGGTGGASTAGTAGASGGGGTPATTEVVLKCPPDPPAEDEDIRTLCRREELAQHCLDEAVKELEDAKADLQALASEAAAGAPGDDADLQEAAVRVRQKTRLVAVANAALTRIRDEREDTQHKYDMARLWRIGMGATGIAGLAAGSRSLTGFGGHLIYRLDPSLEVGALVRLDRLDGQQLTSLRGILGFADERWALLLGVGTSFTENDDVLAIATPLALRFRAGNDLRQNEVTPFLDLGLVVEPWFIENQRTTVFFGVSATVGLGFRRGYDECGLCRDAREKLTEFCKACDKARGTGGQAGASAQ